MEFFFDVETSGFHKNGIEADNPAQAWTVQLGFILSTEDRVFHECNVMFAPPNVNSSIHPKAQETHGISIAECNLGGVCVLDFADYLASLLKCAKLIVCHNYQFDSKFMLDILARCFEDVEDAQENFCLTPHYCTMLKSTELCNLPGRYGKPKWPKLEELHRFLFNEDFAGAHDALADARATHRCFYELRKRGL